MPSSKTEVTTTRVVWDDPALSGVSFEFYRDDIGDVDEVVMTVGATKLAMSSVELALLVQLVADVAGDV